MAHGLFASNVELIVIAIAHCARVAGQTCTCAVRVRVLRKPQTSPFSSPEAALLLVSTKDQHRKSAFHGLSFHIAHAQRQVWQIWLAEKTKLLLCECSENWTLPEDLILGADRKKCGLWEREWLNSSLSLTDQLLTAYSWKTSYSVSV